MPTIAKSRKIIKNNSRIYKDNLRKIKFFFNVFKSNKSVGSVEAKEY